MCCTGLVSTASLMLGASPGPHKVLLRCCGAAYCESHAVGCCKCTAPLGADARRTTHEQKRCPHLEWLAYAGVGGGSSKLSTLVLAGLAGLVGGALSMAVGEFISVSSQRDAEKADIAREVAEQAKGAS